MIYVCVVIVNWNGIKDTLSCLSSIAKIDKRGYRFDVIVVDNGSTDESIEQIHATYPDVLLIAAGKNLGFTGGNNVGIRKAHEMGADYIWLLNNDTKVDRDVLALVSAFDDSRVGIAGSKIYFAPGFEFHKARYKRGERGRVIWYAGGLIDWQNMYASHRGVDEVDHGQFDSNQETPFVTGCSMMIAREVVERVGFLDDRFYLYLEDLDYCLRAQKSGFTTVYWPHSIVWHVNAGSSGGSGSRLHEYYQTRNRLYVGMKYAPVRTKIALCKEALGFMLYGTGVKKQAVVDACLGRWGKGL